MSGAVLTPYDLMALAVLHEGSGFATGRIVEMVTGRPSTQSLSAMMKATLFRLEKRGLVSRLDSEKPIAWTRTPEGSATIAKAHATTEDTDHAGR